MGKASVFSKSSVINFNLLNDSLTTLTCLHKATVLIVDKLKRVTRGTFIFRPSPVLTLMWTTGSHECVKRGRFAAVLGTIVLFHDPFVARL